MRGSELEARLSEAVAERSRALSATRAALHGCQQRHAELQRALRSALQAIAEQRLAAADRAEPLEALGSVDAMLAQVATKRARALAELRAKREQTAVQLEQAEAEAARAGEKASASRAEAETLRSQALARFEATASYARLKQALDDAADLRLQAEAALQSVRRKLSDFDAAVVHPVHRYLRERRYARPDYAASIVVAALDGFAARASRYPEVYLREQLLVGAMQAEVEKAQSAAARHTLCEQELGAAAGAFVDQDAAGPALARAEAEAAELAERDTETLTLRSALRRLQDAIASHEAGQDAAAAEARDAVVEVLLRTSAQVRAAAVGETAAPSDDIAAAEAAQLEAELRTLAREAQDLSARTSREVDALERLEALHTLARRRGWTSSRSRLRALDIGAVIASVLQEPEGLAEASQSLERAHVLEPPPARSSSGWASGGGAWGSGGGFGGGSRASGGSFGGGGRRTGGGF